MLRHDIERLWPLTATYEYAAEAGLMVRNLAPGWWQDFEREIPRARYPLPQAQGYAFLQWLEARPDDIRGTLTEILAGALVSAEPALRVEIAASLDCLERDYVSAGDPFPPHELFEQTVTFTHRPHVSVTPTTVP